MAVEDLSASEAIALANALTVLHGNPKLSAYYRNHRGERSCRTFTPKRVWHGSTAYHPEPGVMLTAFDHDKQADRDFRLADFDAMTLKRADK